MDLGLAGKSALVSGSTAGIGFAIAKELAQEGAHVFVNGRTAGRVQQAVEKIRSTSPTGKVEGIAATSARLPDATFFFTPSMLRQRRHGQHGNVSGWLPHTSPDDGVCTEWVPSKTNAHDRERAHIHDEVVVTKAHSASVRRHGDFWSTCGFFQLRAPCPTARRIALSLRLPRGPSWPPRPTDQSGGRETQESEGRPRILQRARNRARHGRRSALEAVACARRPRNFGRLSSRPGPRKLVREVRFALS